MRTDKISAWVAGNYTKNWLVTFRHPDILRNLRPADAVFVRNIHGVIFIDRLRPADEE